MSEVRSQVSRSVPLYKRFLAAVGLRALKSSKSELGPRPMMQSDEAATYTRWLRKAGSVIEYGAGGSTLLALDLGIKKLVSVETSPQWVEKLRAHPVVANAEESGRLKLIYVDIGPVGRGGRPIDLSRAESFRTYAPAPWEYCDNPHLVLVDGRFRVAAALESGLRAGNDTVIAIHDFWNRPHYHAVLPFFDCIEKVDKLGIFRRKANADLGAMRGLLEDNRNNFA